MDKKTFNILSLDGGGYKGLCIIACLAELEKKFNIKCCDYFDMFAGTSTGAIIALAFAKGESASNILKLYEEIGNKVFPYRIPFDRTFRFLRQFFYPKYRNKHLKIELEKFFGDLKLKDIANSNKYVIVPTLCLSNGMPRIFKTDYKAEYNKHNEYFLSDIILASCSAPTFFQVAKIKIPGSNSHEYFVDGGMFANNPSVCALVEALQNLNKDIKDIKLFSISTPQPDLQLKESNLIPSLALQKGVIGWNEKLVSMALQGTAQRDAFVAKFMMKDSNYLRLEPNCTANTPKGMDSCSMKDKSELIRMGKQLALDNFNNFEKLFLQHNQVLEEEING